MSYAEFDKGDWPIVRISFTGEMADETNFSVYLSSLDDLYVSKERFMIIFDARNARFPGMKFQNLQANWIKDNERKIADTVFLQCM